MSTAFGNSDNGKLPWYAIYTRHQNERIVADTLERSGVEVFLPM